MRTNGEPQRTIVAMGGGNTANMLAIWRVHGVDGILARAWRAGGVLRRAGDTARQPLPALRRRAGTTPTYQRLIAEGALPDGYAVGAAVETELPTRYLG